MFRWTPLVFEYPHPVLEVLVEGCDRHVRALEILMDGDAGTNESLDAVTLVIEMVVEAFDLAEEPCAVVVPLMSLNVSSSPMAKALHNMIAFSAQLHHIVRPSSWYNGEFSGNPSISFGTTNLNECFAMWKLDTGICFATCSPLFSFP